MTTPNQEESEVGQGSTDQAAKALPQASRQFTSEQLNDLIDEAEANVKKAAESLASIEQVKLSAQAVVDTLQTARDTALKTVEAINDKDNALTNVLETATNTNNQISAFQTRASELFDQISLSATNVTAQYNNVVNSANEVARLQSEVITAAGRVNQNEQTAITAATDANAQQQSAANAANIATSNQLESRKALTEVQSALEQIATLVNRATASTESIHAAKLLVDKANGDIAELLQKSGESDNQARAFVEHIKASGETISKIRESVEESSQKVADLQASIDARDKELQVWQSKYTALQKKIEDLLPGATSAGLSNAFLQQKQSYNVPKICYAIMFVASAWFLAIGNKYVPDSEPWMSKIKDPWQGIVADMIHKSPIYLPCILVAYFAFRAFTTADKLQQDYAYKEKIASTFEGFKQQFSNLDLTNDSDAPLNILCGKLLYIIGQHPARFYDRKHIEELSPAKSALEDTIGTAQTALHNLIPHPNNLAKPVLETVVPAATTQTETATLPPKS